MVMCVYLRVFDVLCVCVCVCGMCGIVNRCPEKNHAMEFRDDFF